MIVVMEPKVADGAVETVISHLVANGFDVHRSSGESRVIIGVVGEISDNDARVVRELPGD